MFGHINIARLGRAVAVSNQRKSASIVVSAWLIEEAKKINECFLNICVQSLQKSITVSTREIHDV